MFQVTILLIASFCLPSVRSDYAISQENGTSYLQAEIELVKERIFPSNVTFQVMFAEIVGTLFYSIDKNKNQLIIRLSRGFTQVMVIEFRGHSTEIYLEEICGCSECRYIPLWLSVGIHDAINIRCNGNAARNIAYAADKKLNEGYPLKTFNDTGSNNSAMFWVFNTPTIDTKSKDDEKMQGCIFNIYYREQSVDMKAYGKGIKMECKKACEWNVCNGGICYETYGLKPVCDCTNVFGSGQFCQDESTTTNKYILQSFQFSKIKLTWKANSKIIFALENQKVKLVLLENDNNLNFEYWENEGHQLMIQVRLMDSYKKNEPYILVLDIENKIGLNLTNITSFKRKTSSNLSLEVFHNLTLSSGNGIIDVVYKFHAFDLTWTKWDLNNGIHLNQPTTTHRTVPPGFASAELKRGNDTKITNYSWTESDKKYNRTMLNVIISLVVILLIAIFVIIAMLFIIFKKLHQLKDGLRYR